MADESHCQTCSKNTESSPLLQNEQFEPSPLQSLLLLDKRNGVNTRKDKQLPSKPNICKLPESDVMARMKSFVPFLSDATISTDGEDAVKLVPISDSESGSDSDSSEESDDEGMHVEMRLAVVPDTTSDTEEGSGDEGTLLGEVTAENIKLPQKHSGTNPAPTIEELN